jgi:hypothetical protein
MAAKYSIDMEYLFNKSMKIIAVKNITSGFGRRRRFFNTSFMDVSAIRHSIHTSRNIPAARPTTQKNM